MDTVFVSERKHCATWHGTSPLTEADFTAADWAAFPRKFNAATLRWRIGNAPVAGNGCKYLEREKLLAVRLHARSLQYAFAARWRYLLYGVWRRCKRCMSTRLEENPSVARHAMNLGSTSKTINGIGFKTAAVGNPVNQPAPEGECGRVAALARAKVFCFKTQSSEGC